MCLGELSDFSKLHCALEKATMVDKQSRTRTISAAAFYFTCSLSMNFLNKAVVSSYAFNFPFFILACQMTVTIILLHLLRCLRVLQVTFDLAHMISSHPDIPRCQVSV